MTGDGRPPVDRTIHRAFAAAAEALDDAAPLAADRDREVMDADEVARFLGVDRKTVYDYAGRGVIPCRRLGKRFLFSRRALVLWLGGACKGSSEGDAT